MFRPGFFRQKNPDKKINFISMKMDVSVIKLILLFLFLFCFSMWSCKERNFTVEYYQNIDDVLDHSSNVDFVTSELVNNGFILKADSLVEETDWEYFFRSYKDDSILGIQALEFVTVLENIDSILENNDIVMINENHFLSYQRNFFGMIASKAKHYGYHQVAFEALADIHNSSLMDRSGVFLEAGYYTKDPYYSNMLLKLKDLDYHFISYEPTIEYDNSNGKVRDSLMAENILDRFDSNKKLLIFCGWGHSSNHPYTLRYYLNLKLPEKKIASINQVLLFPESRTTIYENIRSKVLGEFTHPCFLFYEKEPITFSKGFEYEVIFPEDYQYGGAKKISSKLVERLTTLLPDSPCDRLFIYNKNTIQSHEKYVPLAIIHHEKDIDNFISSFPSMIDEISVYKHCNGELNFLENLKI